MNLFLHWIQSFNKHTKQLIVLEFQDRHKTFCYEYKNLRSLEKVTFIMLLFTFGD